MFKSGICSSCIIQKPVHSRSNDDGTTHSDTLSESTLVQEVGRGRDSLHREQSKIGAQLQFDFKDMGDRGPLQIACFLPSAPIRATVMSNTKKVDMLHIVVATQWVCDLGIRNTQKITDMSRNQLTSKFSTYVKNEHNKPDEQLMDHFEKKKKNKDKDVFHRCEGVAR